MAFSAKRRFMRGAISGAAHLHVALPWERGARRQRMALRRMLRVARKRA